MKNLCPVPHMNMNHEPNNHSIYLYISDLVLLEYPDITSVFYYPLQGTVNLHLLMVPNNFDLVTKNNAGGSRYL